MEYKIYFLIYFSQIFRTCPLMYGQIIYENKSLSASSLTSILFLDQLQAFGMVSLMKNFINSIIVVIRDAAVQWEAVSSSC
jgi:hypothetical protein